jgi:hypothetical protein
MTTYIEEFLTTFSGFHQTVFSFLLTAYSSFFPQLTAHKNFFHNHSPTKQTLDSLQQFSHTTPLLCATRYILFNPLKDPHILPPVQ